MVEKKNPADMRKKKEKERKINNIKNQRKTKRKENNVDKRKKERKKERKKIYCKITEKTVLPI